MNTLIVIHQGAIGDFVLSLSLVQAATARLRPAKVIAVASSPAATLAAGRSVIDERRTPDSVGIHTLFATSGELDRRLQSLLSGAGCVLSVLGSADGPIHARLREHTPGRVISIDPRPSEETLGRRRHITDQWCETAMRSGLEIGDLLPPRIEMQSARAHTDDARKHIVIHPGSGGTAKCWPVERFFAVADRLSAFVISWMLGPVETEADNAASQSIHRRAAASRERVVIEEDLTRAAERIAEADLYLGNDAGMSHVAAAFGIPTIVIYGPTDPAVWRPLGDQVAVVAQPQPGGPIDAVSVDAVFGVLAAQLAQDGRASP